MPPINSQTFKPRVAATVKSTALFSHKVMRGTIPDAPGKIWIRKEIKNPALAKSELLAQEFFRLLMPYQPETLLAVDPINGVHYILSEEVKNYRELPYNNATNFEDGTIIGFGIVILGAAYMQETDLKNGNIGLDNKNRVIKIDGDWCFSEGRFQGKYDITPETIARLPNPKDFVAFNWLDLIQEGVKYSSSNMVAPTLSQSPQFRSEVNQAMFMICLLPDSYIERFVDSYIDAGAARYSDLMKARRDAVRLSALANPSFQAYLNSAQAAVDTQRIIDQTTRFTSNKNPLIPLEDRENLTKEIHAKRALLNAPESQILLSAIQAHAIGNNDIIMNTYIKEQQSLIVKHENNPAETAKLMADMQDTLAILNSAEITTVKNQINTLRKEAVNYYVYMEKADIAKADAIESALSTIPIDQRGTVLTNNKVQSALGIVTPSECMNILHAIKETAINNRDEVMKTYFTENENFIILNAQDANELLKIKNSLTNDLVSLQSPELIAVKQTINTIRKEAGSFTIGKLDKAKRIEDALCKIPINKRGEVISHEGAPNDVQKALASKRVIKGKVYLNQNDNTIDMKKAAPTFQELKKQFAKAANRPSQEEPEKDTNPTQKI